MAMALLVMALPRPVLYDQTTQQHSVSHIKRKSAQVSSEHWGFGTNEPTIQACLPLPHWCCLEAIIVTGLVAYQASCLLLLLATLPLVVALGGSGVELWCSVPAQWVRQHCPIHTTPGPQSPPPWSGWSVMSPRSWPWLRWRTRSRSRC